MNRQNNNAAGDFYEPTTQDSLRNVMRFLRAVSYRRSTIAWSLLAAFALAGGYYSIAPRYYRSAAKLQIIYQDADSLSPKNELDADDVMATHRELVRTERVVGEAIKNLAPEHRTDLDEVPPNKWVQKIKGGLSASTIRKTKLIEVGYQSRSPDAAAAVVSAVINSYLAYVAETHRGTAAELYEDTQARMARNQQERASKQFQLIEARRAVGDLKADPTDGVVDPLIAQALSLNDALVEATQERVQIESSLATVQAAIARGDDLRQYLSLIEETVGEQMLMSSLGIGPQDLKSLAEQQQRLLEMRAKMAKLNSFLGPNHPEMRVLAEQIAGVEQFLGGYHTNVSQRFNGMSGAELGPMLTSMLARSAEQARLHENRLEQSFMVARDRAAVHSGKLLAIATLQRELTRLDDQYDQLFTKSNGIDPQQIQSPIRASIVQEPLPALEPSSPKLATTFLAALLGGFGVGCVVVYLQDMLDDRFDSPEEMSQHLGLPVLSIIRQFDPLDANRLDAVHAYAGVDSAQGEAFRTLRTAIAIGSESSERLAVSSAEPSDGKTTVCMNLAVSFAQVGKRTLVIDADLRKPGMTALMDLKGQPGVTDLLQAPTRDLRELAGKLLHSTKQEGLDVIPAGPRRHDAAELLSGANFAELLSWAESKYDQVLIDCPPVLAVSDAQVIGQLTDGVMLVVSPEKNHRRLVVRATESFLSAGIHLFGVVANRVSQRSEQGYGYGYGYGYGEDEPIENDSTGPMISTGRDDEPEVGRAA